MLVLSRKSGERIRISDDITLTVLSISGGKVRLGFAAPAHISIQREEIAQRIDAERSRKTGLVEMDVMLPETADNAT